MKIHLPDPGDPRTLLGHRANGQPIWLARGGAPDEDPPDTDPDTDPDEEDPDEEDPDSDPDEEDGKGKDKDPPELATWKRKAKRRDGVIRRLQAELAEERKGKDDKDSGPSAEERANAKLIRASARTVLAELGVTDRADQGSVLEVIRLDGVEVDQDGDPDEDEIRERVEALRDIFTRDAPQARKRTPRINTKDQGSGKGQDQQADEDSKRYKRILGKR